MVDEPRMLAGAATDAGTELPSQGSQQEHVAGGQTLDDCI